MLIGVGIKFKFRVNSNYEKDNFGLGPSAQ
jgi:hypothetical protein